MLTIVYMSTLTLRLVLRCVVVVSMLCTPAYALQGLPMEWEAMLKSSGITKDEVIDNSDAVLSVLEFQAKRLLPPTPTQHNAACI
jgi:hypothetical protein